jgi:uncharacterized membrane protein
VPHQTKSIDYATPGRRRPPQVWGWVLVILWVGVILFLILACLLPVVRGVLPRHWDIGPRN